MQHLPSRLCMLTWNGISSTISIRFFRHSQSVRPRVDPKLMRENRIASTFPTRAATYAISLVQLAWLLVSLMKKKLIAHAISGNDARV